MKNRLFLFLLFFIFAKHAYADHIIGVDMAMSSVNTSKGNFKFIMNIFIDHRVQPDPRLEKENIINIYRKSDGKFMTLVLLYGYTIAENDLTYSNSKCAEKNDLHIYTQHLEREVFLDLNDYDDPLGYIVVFDRCCRSKTVSNIQNNENTPMSVTIEFPSLKKYPTYSSAEFNVPNGEFLCVNEPFQMNFDVKNANGKDIRYKLTESLSGVTRKGAPFMASPPSTMIIQPFVTWVAGRSGIDPIPSSKKLEIDSKSGVLSVTSNKKGVYCFAVMAEEYINGQRIGHITRDYTLVVVDCPTNKPIKPIINYLNSPIREVSFCPGSNLVLETQDNSNWNFVWQNSNDNIPNETRNSITVKDTGTYKVIKSLKTTCSDESISETVKVKLETGATLIKIKSNLSEVCIGNIIKLSLEDTNQIVDWFYTNTFIQKSKTINADKTGEYIAKVSNSITSCSTGQDKFKVNILDKPKVPLNQSNFEFCSGDKLDLITTNDPKYIYQWYRNDTLLQGANSFKLIANKTGTFKVKVNYSTIICEQESPEYIVSQKLNCGSVPPILGSVNELYIPNTISPNSDGLNDEWKIWNVEKFPEIEVSIFNLWGEIVYHSNGYSVPFNGYKNEKLMPVGSYTYIIKPNSIGYKTLKGSIYILY
jgi:gliding motility-associated-like protein